MKYRIIIMLHISLFTLSSYAQVAINTVNPQEGPLHIDALGNNPTTGTPSASEQVDDVFIDAQGNVALGHISPQYKLDLKSTHLLGGVKIEDGTQGSLKVLQSDANGFGSWKYEGMPMVKGVLPITGLTIDPALASSINEFVYVGAYIDLPPGQWLVMVNMLVSTTGVPSAVYKERTWMRTTFTDSPSTKSFSTSISGAPLASGALFSVPNSLIQGSIILSNSTAATKRYYYTIDYIDVGLPSSVRISNFATATSPENSIIALKMK